jgi:pimeloyl-ACP methyl ester carboxylesterase/tetratricopeptide (TPR) repeat protein
MLIITLLITSLAFAQHPHAAPNEKPAALVEGMGNVHHPVTTTNAEAQRFFDQGLAYLYAFNHDEAARAFRRAADLDPQLAMAHWGIALALGSNYNLQADAPQLKAAYASLQTALRLAANASEHERAYINALSKRYSGDPKADVHRLAVDYKNAMAELVKHYPDDLDAATLYAESLMNLRPWKLWTPDGQPAEGTAEIVATLESVLRRDPQHTGANHYYIHAVEASPNPERALPSAARLERLAPAAGHLVHMPSHIYVRTGDYEAAAKSNADAIVADRAYFKASGAQGVYPMMYGNHNVHFLASANAMSGRYADAIKAARELEAGVKPHLKMMPMLEMFAPYATVTLVRFHRWDEVLRLPEPERELKITGAMWRFARGMAYAASRQTANAEAEQKALRELIEAVPADAPFGNSTARGVLAVAEHLLAGRIAFARGDKARGIEMLKKAVEAEDALSYNEPADWDLPVREWLGGALLAGGDAVTAEAVFRAELSKHPRNGRALFGLLESLKRQGKTSATRMVQREFDRAWAQAGTKLSADALFDMPGDVKPSPGRDVPSLQPSEVRLKTGVRLRYAVQGDPAGSPIVMLHGYTDSSFSFSRVLPLLSDSLRVFVLDQRGHGDSDRPARGYHASAFVADVVAFMEAKNLKGVTLVGHSMGSLIAQRVALSAPGRVARLVLIGSATTARTAAVVEFMQEVRRLKDPIPEKFVRDFQLSTAHQPLPAEFLDGVIAESLKVPARVWVATLEGLLAADKPDLSRIAVPTLIIWGDRDQFFPRAEQDSLAALLRGAVLKVYRETGHDPHWERPEQFARDLERFMSQTASR